MELFKIFTKLVIGIIKITALIITAVLLTIGFAVFFAFIERSIFVTDGFILWTIQDSSMRIMYLFEAIIIGAAVYLGNRKKPGFKDTKLSKLVSLVKNNKGIQH